MTSTSTTPTLSKVDSKDEIIYQLEAKMFLLTSGLPASAADLLDK